MNKISRRAFLQAAGLTAAAAALSACSGGTGSSASFHVAVPTTPPTRPAPSSCWRRTASSP